MIIKHLLFLLLLFYNLTVYAEKLTPLVEQVDDFIMCIKSIQTKAGETHLLTGTGVQIAPGVMATVVHQVDQVASMTVYTTDGLTSSGKVIAMDRDNDLALVQIAERPGGIRLIENHKVTIGEAVFTIGCPFGLEHSLSKGYVKKPRVIVDDRAFIEMDMSIHTGDSGAPVFDSQGRWIGVVGGYLKKARVISFAMPIEFVINLVKNSAGEMIAPPSIETLWSQTTTAQGAAQKKLFIAITNSVAANSRETYFTGLSYYALGNLPKAVVSVNAYITSNPSDHIARVILAEIYIDQKEYQKALQNLLAAKKLQPDYAILYLYLGKVYDLGFANVKAARKNFQTFLTLSPDSTQSYRIKRWLTKHKGS